MNNPKRSIFENVFSLLSKHNWDKYFAGFDPQTKWVCHGEHPFTGNYNGLQEIKQGYSRYIHLFQSTPQFKLRNLMVEGNKAIAHFYHEGTRKDGKPFTMDQWLVVELGNDGKKILMVDDYVDAHKLSELCKVTEHHQKRTA